MTREVAEDVSAPAAAGALAAGATGLAAGALAERRLVRRGVRPPDAGPALPTLSGTREQSVTCDDGVRLAVRETGPDDAALTLVFVHGYTVTSECWAAQVRDLSRDERPGGLRIVLYDQRGHGASESGDAASHTLEQLGARPRRRADASGCPDGPVVLVGHSMGGMTIMALAAAAARALREQRRRGGAHRNQQRRHGTGDARAFRRRWPSFRER